jgi:hypothetical protein
LDIRKKLFGTSFGCHLLDFKSRVACAAFVEMRRDRAALFSQRRELAENALFVMEDVTNHKVESVRRTSQTLTIQKLAVHCTRNIRRIIVRL